MMEGDGDLSGGSMTADEDCANNCIELYCKTTLNGECDFIVTRRADSQSTFNLDKWYCYCKAFKFSNWPLHTDKHCTPSQAASSGPFTYGANDKFTNTWVNGEHAGLAFNTFPEPARGRVEVTACSDHFTGRTQYPADCSYYYELVNGVVTPCVYNFYEFGYTSVIKCLVNTITGPPGRRYEEGSIDAIDLVHGYCDIVRNEDPSVCNLGQFAISPPPAPPFTGSLGCVTANDWAERPSWDSQPHGTPTFRLCDTDADCTQAAFEAGASIAHCHVRDDEGKPTSDPDRFAALKEGIETHCPGMIVQLSTGGRSGAGRARGAGRRYRSPRRGGWS